ncbi:MAG: BamA/TamA family outer membrane protein [Candidatus Cloacimonetes bacterium]|nr:BamA/TamA family outer membrane protein [Candidatus Cloacimonadota bacterium]
MADTECIEGIIIKGNFYFSERKLYEHLNHNLEKAITFVDLEKILYDLTDLYLSRGMLFVKIYLSEVSLQNGVSQATINIEEGPIIRAENFIISGNKEIKEKTILKESGIRRNQDFTIVALLLAEKKLNAKQYIALATIIPVDENTILINIVETRSTYFSGILGYSNSPKKQENFSGYLDVDFMNLFGTDRSLKFSWKQLPECYRSYQVGYHESGPLEVALGGDISLYREEKDSTYVKTKIDTDIYYHYLYQKLGMIFGYNKLFPGDREIKQFDKQTEKQVGIFWYGDYTDNLSNPSTGWEANLRQSLIFVKTETKSLKRFLVEANVANYFSVSRSLVLANSISCKQIENKSLTMYDLIPIGGTFSLRGFYEEAYRGDTTFVTNTELRYLLTRNSRTFVFFDYGYVVDNHLDYSNKFDDLYGLGFGLRLDTKIGLLHLDYGFHYAEGKWMKPSKGIIHFGIETKF